MVKKRVISLQSKKRIEKLIRKGIDEGAKPLADGRYARIPSVDPNSDIARTEIFGPVLSLLAVNTIDEPILLVHTVICLFVYQ